ncbi:hypothetical protein Rsub_07971 [Raphidocelis subcapitata]|uniref:DUF3054 domain-containing protein n=1 Tax=Raphidocelis subcapitata TaxID=307507 RepID=A0A2V0P5F1_9CHLO|nr:hypothetical protein Rsub_07971 [Raphidocelis subcapitata]|eukprot:GBF94799.1 hypothetical protein Rsub_07971 [Raphidocelis subcapitata]
MARTALLGAPRCGCSALAASSSRSLVNGRRCVAPRAAAGDSEPGVKPAGAVRPAPPRPMPPRGPPVMLGPDGQPLEVVPVERASKEAWAGVAAVDRGESDERAVDWGRVALLAGGDAAVLLAFAAVGRANHGEPLAGALETAAPFLIGWFAAAPFLGGYGRDARGGAAGPAAAAAAKCWAVGAPLGLAVRGLSKGYMPPTPFIIVSLVATAVLMVGWRTGLAAATPEAAPASKAVLAQQRQNKRGNPFEFISLLMSLTKRW